MHLEFIVAVTVLLVAVLVAADFFRRTSASPQESAPQDYIGGPARDAGPETSTAPRAGSAPSPSAFEAARAGPAANGRPYQDIPRLDSPRLDIPRLDSPRLDSPRLDSPRLDTPYPGARHPGTRYPHAGAASRAAPPGTRKNWLVRARLSLLALVSAAAAALATASVLHASDALHGASFHSGVSSMRDGAVASAVLALVCAALILAAGLWSAIVLIRSVLRPLQQVRAGAVDLAEVWLPDALRHITQVGGQGGPPGARPVGVAARDEIGDVARALDQVQGEILRMAGDEAGLRGKLSELFAELSARGQVLMDRQLRLISELEPGERDAERLASLVTVSDLATRMRRYSQNLLVLAGRELPGRWHQPVMLVDVIRVGVSQIGDQGRVSVRAQPGIAVSGPAANDLAHLVAELAENATSLSAADTPVSIWGRALATGGVLVEVTDQGVGMNPETMAQANRRLDNPPPVNAAVSRSMGLFVVGRLAARHGVKVRLQPASAGGLTALVWLPDAIVVLPDAGAPADLGAEREAMASSVWPAPTPSDVMAHQPPPQAPAATTPGQPPRNARAPGPQRPPLRLRPIRAAARPQPSVDGAAAAAGDPVPVAGPVAAGPVDDAADERRLPIYEAVESDWFGNCRTLPVGPAAADATAADATTRSATAGDAIAADATTGGATAGGGAPAAGNAAAARGRWRAPDRGFQAARAVLAPSSGGVTTAGLPVRVPRANLVPGTIGSPPSDASAPARSAAAIRDRLAGFQRGTSQGRAAVNRDSQDEAS